MARTIRGTWILPTTRTSGGPLPPEEIKQAAVDVSLDQGANWTPLNVIPPTDPQELVVQDAAAGRWDFRVIITDTADRASDPLEGFVVVPDETPPSPATDLTLTLE